MSPKKENPVTAFLRAIGSKGGKAKAANMTDAQRKQIGRDLAAARARAAKARAKTKRKKPAK